MNSMQKALARQIQRQIDLREGFSATALSRELGRDPGYVGHILKGTSQNPSVFDIAKIADYFSCSIDELLERGEIEGPVLMSKIPVVGPVQPGVWRRHWRRGASQYHIAVPADTRWPSVRRYGVFMVGNSMNRIYPDGATLVIADFTDLRRKPQPEDHVIYRRWDTVGLMEVTAAVLRRDEKGQRWIWPASTDPEFQQPLLVGEGHGVAEAAAAYGPASVPDRREPVGEPTPPEIFARVLSSYQTV